MSLDVSLILKTPIRKKRIGVFIRENRKTFETKCVFDANITHNLNKMADAAGIYEACWRPEEIGATKASNIIPILEKGYKDMIARPEYFKKFDSENGWGTYKDFLPWVKSYLKACRKYPDAIIEVSR